MPDLRLTSHCRLSKAANWRAPSQRPPSRAAGSAEGAGGSSMATRPIVARSLVKGARPPMSCNNTNARTLKHVRPARPYARVPRVCNGYGITRVCPQLMWYSLAQFKCSLTITTAHAWHHG
jgi:hypothetical protein